MSDGEDYTTMKPARWMLPCLYCRRNPCTADQYPPEIIGMSINTLSDEKKVILKRIIHQAGLRIGMACVTGSACAALNLWSLKAGVSS